MREPPLEFLDPGGEHRTSDAADPLIDAWGMSDIGCRRRTNEDSYLIADLRRWMLIEHTSLPGRDGARLLGSPQGKLLVVADGMGGHGGGDLASQVVIDAMARYVMQVMPWLPGTDDGDDDDDDDPLTAALGDAVARCQDRLHEVVRQRGIEAARPGTTLTVAYMLWPALYVAHVGDSRCYLQRNNRLLRLTTDHTVAQRLYESHVIDQDELERSPLRHTLFNAVGGGTEDLRPDLARFELTPGDTLLLCTDGLTGHLSDAELLAHLRVRHGAAQCCQRLVHTARERGGLDNITVLIARHHRGG